MALDPRIILAGRQPDLVNTLARSGLAAGQANQVRDQNALRQLYQTQGPGIASGDPTAMNALSRLDPQAAFGMGQQRQAGQRAARADTRAQGNYDAQMQEYARGLTAEQAAAEAAKIKQGVMMASGAQTPEQWDQIVTSLGQNDLVGQFGQKDALLRQYMTMQQILEQNAGPKPGYDVPKGYQLADPQNPQIGVRPLVGYKQEDNAGYRVATPEEAAKYGASAGQIDEKTGRFYPITPPKGMKITSDGRGGFTLTEGAGVGTSEDTMGMDVTGAPAMIASIDGVLSDDALDWSTGWLAWRQKIPGTDAYRFGTRVDQLNGQAFLQAFQSLKGGGQITEVEGQKATQAIGRLDSAQQPDDYRKALNELRDILVLGQSRPKGWTGDREQVAPKVGTIEGGHRFLGGDPASPSSWEVVK